MPDNKPISPRRGRWTVGADDVERLIDKKELDVVAVNDEHADLLMGRAQKNLEAAESLLEHNPEGAFTLLYDAARIAVTSLLARQGLRPTTTGGHIAVQDAVRAQLGNRPGRLFGLLRRTRNDVEYPAPDSYGVDVEDVRAALDDARAIVDGVRAVSPRVGPFF